MLAEAVASVGKHLAGTPLVMEALMSLDNALVRQKMRWVFGFSSRLCRAHGEQSARDELEGAFQVIRWAGLNRLRSRVKDGPRSV